MMISVIIPLYNKEKIIERTIQSVLSQDYDDFELIVVNDGSTDNSAEIVRKVQDSRLRLIDQENGGPSKARNRGVCCAKGDWILFLDADDELQTDALSIFSEYILKEPKADMFIGEVRFNYNDSISYGCKYKEKWVKNPFKAHFFSSLTECTGSTIYRKELCLKYPFDEKLWRYEDLQPLFEMYRCCRLYLVPHLVVQINVTFASVSHARKNINEDFMGHIDFSGKSFWEKMCLYKFYIGERTYYENECRTLYPTLRYRYDLLILFKLLTKFMKY